MRGILSYIFLFLLLCISCKSEKSMTESKAVRVDTVHSYKYLRDSVRIVDSIYVNQFLRGETVFVSSLRYRDRWHEVLVKDTMYVSSIDSIPYPVYVDKVIVKEAELSRIQKGLMVLGVVFLLVILLTAVIMYLVYRKR